MTKEVIIEVKDGKVKETINSFLSSLLEKNLVSALLVPREVPSKDNVVQSLVTTSDGLKEANVFAPILPVNSAEIISKMTRLTSYKSPVGVILRSCEIRALIELVKLKQASLDNLLIIGVDCLGTYSVSDYQNFYKQDNSPSNELLKKFKEGKEDAKLREACRVCEYPTPSNTDLTVGLIGVDFEKGILLKSCTEKGEEILEKFSYPKFDQSKEREESVSKYISEKIKERDELFSQTKKEVGGWKNLLSVFSTCISCHNCMRVCPICYCRECFFESPAFEFSSEKYLGWAKKKGSIRMPKDTILFHLGRMNHMATSCVGCGVCEQACPSGIPLLKIFKTVSHNVQEIFNYVPGRNLEEPLPLTTFKEDELQSVGEEQNE
ncbi:Coenzyme F420 hydrogenase/dehydrogenase, beta subunit C-terminal domain [Candidatus Aerophobetes bacterium]|nr:Coenzyme F420 hydrogenase/dehydrogenase, beta subunit C-terminal domain [Candidatus Aerophobetes bacterium]